jgi:hypothetical protein
LIDESSLTDSIGHMVILRNNQSDCLWAGFGKQFPKLRSGCATRNETQRNGLDCAAKTGTVDCSKSIISLEFFGYFLFQDNCAAINEAKKQ